MCMLYKYFVTPPEYTQHLSILTKIKYTPIWSRDAIDSKGRAWHYSGNAKSLFQLHVQIGYILFEDMALQVQ